MLAGDVEQLERHHFSLPVFDQPDLKARWRLELELPEEWVAVANGAEVITKFIMA